MVMSSGHPIYDGQTHQRNFISHIISSSQNTTTLRFMLDIRPIVNFGPT